MKWSWRLDSDEIESSVTFSSITSIIFTASLRSKVMSSQSNTFSAHQQNALEKEGNKSDYPHANEIQSYATSEGDSEDEFHDCEEVDSDTQVIFFFCLSDSARGLSSHDFFLFNYLRLKHSHFHHSNKYYANICDKSQRGPDTELETRCVCIR